MGGRHYWGCHVADGIQPGSESTIAELQSTQRPVVLNEELGANMGMKNLDRHREGFVFCCRDSREPLELTEQGSDALTAEWRLD